MYPSLQVGVDLKKIAFELMNLSQRYFRLFIYKKNFDGLQINQLAQQYSGRCIESL